jgi:type IV secretion system protein VirB10
LNTDEERMHDRDSIAAARSSAVLVELRREGSQDEGASRKLEPAPSVEVPGSASSSTQPPAGQLEKLDFARSPAGSTNRATLQAAASPFTLMAGTIIPASLITGLNSDLPGVVIAQVTENVRDSATGTVILVPQGARLVGRYDSVVAFGQRRALVVWNRITFPDASSIELDNQPASDASGYAGLSDGVDAHTWQLLKGIGLSTLLGVGTQLSIGSSESDLVRAIRESAQQSVANTGSQITAHDLDVQPTITIRPGWPVRAMLSKDVQLRPWRG